MRELLSSDILPLIINYLRENGYNKACKSLEKKVGGTEANKFS